MQFAIAGEYQITEFMNKEMEAHFPEKSPEGQLKGALPESDLNVWETVRQIVAMAQGNDISLVPIRTNEPPPTVYNGIYDTLEDVAKCYGEQQALFIAKSAKDVIGRSQTCAKEDEPDGERALNDFINNYGGREPRRMAMQSPKATIQGEADHGLAEVVRKRELIRGWEEKFAAQLPRLGLTLKDLEGKTVLHITSGEDFPLAEFLRYRGVESRILSIDHIHAEGILGASDDKLQQSTLVKVPTHYDFILYCDVLHRSITKLQTKEGEWNFPQGDYARFQEELRLSIRRTIVNSAKHLTPGGRIIIYPVWPQKPVNFGGEVKDFTLWRGLLDEELTKLIETHEDNFTMKFEPGSGEDEDDPVVRERLIIERRK